MQTFVLVCVLMAAALVMASGVWVATALIAAIWHVERPASEPQSPARPQGR